MMENVRIGIIGIGSMGLNHARYLINGEVPGAELTAVSARSSARLETARQELGPGIAYFNDNEALMASGKVDAVLIATPHATHPALATKAFEHDLHVLLEKPSGITTQEVREMNGLATKSGVTFGIMYQLRTHPVYQKLKELIASGELGELKRTNWINTFSYRSQGYYDLDDWRGTWAGEGGGVLLNQALHQLDIWQWICGMPKRLRAFCSFGKYHRIEVEDEVNTIVEYPNGATGMWVASTGEAPGTNRLEVIGERGKVVIEDDKLSFWRLRIPERQFNWEYRGGFGMPECWKVEVPVSGNLPTHAGITRDWVNAILHGTPQLAPGIEGVNALELSNGMLLSTWTDAWVELPVDGGEFCRLLQEKQTAEGGRNQ